jgi:hypothetical protein
MDSPSRCVSALFPACRRETLRILKSFPALPWNLILEEYYFQQLSLRIAGGTGVFKPVPCAMPLYRILRYANIYWRTGKSHSDQIWPILFKNQACSRKMNRGGLQAPRPMTVTINPLDQSLQRRKTEQRTRCVAYPLPRDVSTRHCR